VAGGAAGPGAVGAAVDATLEEFGRIDAVVANAGYATHDTLADGDPEGRRDMVLTNVLGPALLIHARRPAGAAAPHGGGRRGGRHRGGPGPDWMTAMPHRTHSTPRRARDLGIPLRGRPGRHNAITDVAGVEVGYVTRISGEPGDRGPVVRTGVTALLPRGRTGVGTPLACGTFSLNGNGELTGRTWLDESGALDGPVMITNTHAVGACHRGVIDWTVANRPGAGQWLLPVVGETWDGYLNDINGDHIAPRDAVAAIDAARGGPVAEGSVGGGTGMNCYGYKAGSGTASRVTVCGGSIATVGAFVQANFGRRDELVIGGQYLGKALAADNPFGRGAGAAPAGAGSVIVVVATDAPLLPGQCAALARRVPLGLARTGTTGSHFSGDIFLAFSTANPGALTSNLPTAGEQPALEHLDFVPWGRIDPLFTATVEAVEEAVLNALVAGRDMTGRAGHRSPGIPLDVLEATFPNDGPTG
jgi:D-aminopeptidase